MAAALPQILTANRLKDGDVLYWRGGGWVETLTDGEVFADAALADAALAQAQSFVTGNVVVSPYLFDVTLDGRPMKEREIIRSQGPSVREDLGKQAQGPTSLLWGGRKSEGFSGGGPVPTDGPAPSPEALRASTSPQGGGESDYDVSI